MSEVLYSSRNYGEIERTLADLPLILAGQRRDATGLARGIMLRLGLQAMSYVREDFVRKAKGQAGESGDVWAPLSPKTIAYSRRHPGLPAKSRRGGLRPSAALNRRQRVAWWAAYRQGLAMFDGDKRRAAGRAWNAVKAMGATTIMDRYGSMKVEILRDTGLLLTSLTPGLAVGHGPTPTSVQRQPNQIIDVGPGSVIVGTNRAHASAHHRGVPGRIPARPLWPSPDRWPDRWKQGILTQLRLGIYDLVRAMAR